MSAMLPDGVAKSTGLFQSCTEKKTALLVTLALGLASPYLSDSVHNLVIC